MPDLALDEDPITADDVHRFAPLPLRADHAERIATYANHRAAGLWPPEARSLMDITTGTGTNYERWTNTIRAGLGLPPLPVRRLAAPLPSGDRLAAAVASGNHSRWHTGRGVTQPGCRLCANTTTNTAKDNQ